MAWSVSDSYLVYPSLVFKAQYSMESYDISCFQNTAHHCFYSNKIISAQYATTCIQAKLTFVLVSWQ